MKIIITESQYNHLTKNIPIHIRRRMSENDLDIIENIIWDKVDELDYYVSDSKEFVDSIVSDSIHDFIVGYKLNDVEDSNEVHSKIYDLWWEILPIIKGMFELELTIYYYTVIEESLTKEEIMQLLKSKM